MGLRQSGAGKSCTINGHRGIVLRSGAEGEGFRGGLSAFGSAGCDFLQAAEGFVDCVGVGEGFHQLGGDEDDVGTLLDAGAVLATDSVAEVEGGALGERIEFRRPLDIWRISAAVAARAPMRRGPEMVSV